MEYPANTGTSLQPLASWPLVDGSYQVGNPTAPVAVCALTSTELLGLLARMPGVAIAGAVQTANLGIERIIANITSNPAIRFLLLCGKESRLFRPGQSLGALVEHGVDDQGKIINAQGYEPVLRNLPRQQIDLFRHQVELIDWTGERELPVLEEKISGLAARNTGQFAMQWVGDNLVGSDDAAQPQFTSIAPGGRREPLIYDPKGYFVITIDRAAGQIVLRHYLPDHTPAHEMRGRGAETMLLGLIREELISQLSHAGYLGGELAKAESALRLGIKVCYEQDRPLRYEAAPTAEEEDAPPSRGPASAQTWEQFTATPVGERVDGVIEVTGQLAEHLLEGVFGDPSADDPMRSYRRTEHLARIRWNSDTQVVMGNTGHFTPGALLRAQGVLRPENEIEARLIAVITQVAQIS